MVPYESQKNESRLKHISPIAPTAFLSHLTCDGRFRIVDAICKEEERRFIFCVCYVGGRKSKKKLGKKQRD